MKRWAARLFAVIGLSASAVATAQTQDNATLFFYGKPPTQAQIEAAAPGARVATAKDGRFTETTIHWPDVTLVITIDPDWEREVQLSGMQGWIETFPAAETRAPAIKAFLANLERTTTAYGSIIRPRYDAEGKVAATLLRLIQPEGGYFFSHQSIYDAKGQRIIGLPGDPPRLGPR